jgi:hypothetical protein
MKTSVFKFLVVTVLALGLAAGSAAQTPAKRGLPFAVGESLTFEAKISRIIKGIAVADLSFSVVAEPGTDNLVINSEARSKGTLVKLFRFSFLQQYESTIDPVTLRILETKKHDVQRDRVRDSGAIFDYKEKRVIFIETDPNDPSRPPRKIASTITENANDMVSGFYFLRAMPLTVGQTVDVIVSDSGLMYTVPVKIAAREQQKSIFGKVWCFRLEPDIFGPGRLIERKGSMTIWMTDDDRRLPVRSQINTEYGRVEVKLKTASNIK